MAIEAPQLLLLLNWMSPAFPTGGFAYSHGLEWVIENGLISDANDLEAYISDLVVRGSGWNDAVLFSRCWDEGIEALNELALALTSSRERYLETTQMGSAFRSAARIFKLDASSQDGCEIAYPVAAGSACIAAGLGKRDALLAYCQGFCAALTSVAVRLVPLGQTAGLEVLRNLMPVIARTAERAASATRDDLGSITISADIAAMKHETQHSRIFRT